MVRLTGKLIRFLKADRMSLALAFPDAKSSLLAQEQGIA
jgi:hypothetical protein